MGIAFLHGNGGGSSGGGSGAGLIIVGGTTRPAKPTQNMIWVNTDVEITSYVLSATEPENPVEGMVWITIGNSGGVKIVSPVSDEWITVYPLSAKQYVGGAWVDVEAKSYQGGEWVDWIMILFDNGAVVPWTIRSENTGTCTIDTKITIDALSSRVAVVYPTDKIDVTNFKKLKATVKYLSGNINESTFGAYIGVDDVISTSMRSWEATFTSEDKTETNFEVNISNVIGERYIQLGCYGVKYECTKLWLE